MRFDLGTKSERRKWRSRRRLCGSAVSGVVLHKVFRLLGRDHVDVTHLNNTKKERVSKDSDMLQQCQTCCTTLTLVTLFLNLTP